MLKASRWFCGRRTKFRASSQAKKKREFLCGNGRDPRLEFGPVLLEFGLLMAPHFHFKLLWTFLTLLCYLADSSSVFVDCRSPKTDF
jgi:hypothetical protein